MNRLIYRLKNLMEERTLSQAYICRATGLSNTVLNRWLSNTYEGDVQKVCSIIESFLQRESEKYSTRKLDFVMTSVARKVFEVARIAHIDCEIGVCYGQAGLGKTQAAKEYASLNPDVILIEADLGYTTRVLFSEIHKKLGLDGGGMIHSLLEDIIAKLKNSGRLIIVDEAEHLPYRALELIRRIHDKYNLMKTLYSIRSSIVHTGEVKKNKDINHYFKLLADIARQSILLYIEDKEIFSEKKMLELSLCDKDC